MNEQHLGYKVRQVLNQDLELDPATFARIGDARERALARQRVTARRRLLVWADNVTGAMGRSLSPLSHLVLPTLMLILGLIAISTWQQSQVAQELEEIDAAVLTSDLPIDAYLDRGFYAWLKRSSQ